ncbi:uncharacterized protein [Diabrotica undecimpunctata]|uniref:uncharacterized protein n=1 Tax=Diabrotica undecimpunctata TaxID=50387 RepID=UPI003B6324A8
MVSKLLLCVMVAVAAIADVTSSDICWGHTSVVEIKTLFTYCKQIIPTNFIFDNELLNERLNLKGKDSSSVVCDQIKEWLNKSNDDLKTLSKFNNCMTQKTDGLEFDRIKKLCDCLPELKEPVLIKNVKEIIYEQNANRIIYKYLNKQMTETNKDNLNRFIDCLEFHTLSSSQRRK